MTHEELMQEIQEIFRDNFDDDSLVITRETTAEDIEDWDSLEQINLLTAMEKKFGVKFTLDDVRGLENVGDMADLILRLKAYDTKEQQRGSASPFGSAAPLAISTVVTLPIQRSRYESLHIIPASRRSVS